jgi:hypothetical protein
MYHQRGVYVVQMTMEAPDSPYCYYQLFSGKHDQSSGEIVGAWVDVARYEGLFRLEPR